MIGIDFFCGGGGMTKGLIDAGVDMILGFDSNPACRDTYEINNNVPYKCCDITEMQLDDLIEEYPEIVNNEELIIVGCAPCQPFSKQRNSTDEHRDENLLDYFGNVVSELLPGFIVVENVPGIQNNDVFDRFIKRLKRNNYKVVYDVLNAKNYGVPQNRRRLVLIASRICMPELPKATHGEKGLPYVTVRDAIYRFPRIQAGERHANVPNHMSARLSELNLRRIHATPHDGGGRTDWPDDFVLDCHNNGHTGHTDVYGRMYWDRVAPTLTSKCFSLSNGRFGHPEQDRAISMREAASLQSFPETYIFYGTQGDIGKQIGNAVPVLLAMKIGQQIQILYDNYLNNNNEIG